MNSRKKILPLVLVGVAVVVWSTVFIRFSGYLSPEAPSNSPENAELLRIDSVDFHQRTIPFHGNYRDPFVREASVGENRTVALDSSVDEPEEKKIEWPAIELRGVIGSTALLRNMMDETVLYVVPGDQFQDLTVTLVTADSVLIQHESDTMTLRVSK